MFRKKASAPRYSPDPANGKGVVLWSWLESVSIWCAAMAPVRAQQASDLLLDALTPLSFGPLLAADGSAHAFAHLPAFQARSLDFVHGEAGWLITVIALESPDRTGSVLLWWIVGSAHATGDEMARFDTCIRQAHVPERFRQVGAAPCVVVGGRVAENTTDVFAAYRQKDRLRVSFPNHELGRQIAGFVATPIAR